MKTARVFNNGNSQAVRLPKAFRIEVSEVYIRRDEASGDIVLSQRPPAGPWAAFFALRGRTRVPGDFLSARPHNEAAPLRDPLAAPKTRRRPARKS